MSQFCQGNKSLREEGRREAKLKQLYLVQEFKETL